MYMKRSVTCTKPTVRSLLNPNPFAQRVSWVEMYLKLDCQYMRFTYECNSTLGRPDG